MMFQSGGVFELKKDDFETDRSEDIVLVLIRDIYDGWIETKQQAGFNIRRQRSSGRFSVLVSRGAVSKLHDDKQESCSELPNYVRCRQISCRNSLSLMHIRFIFGVGLSIDIFYNCCPVEGSKCNLESSSLKFRDLLPSQGLKPSLPQIHFIFVVDNSTFRIRPLSYPIFCLFAFPYIRVPTLEEH
jgi:hypothetical protein